ncbi:MULTISPECIES: polyprenyl diphosphate synthase [Caulobacter]|jgi:undecaprenyl diphosphate synthase|uniref:Isoprenyl transferase n=1 Tax=Caulobacter vibrioides OR37 TaxID=1292034 RepID=R0EPA3_CAUVI|nr:MULTISPECIES: polyprenyl diphosphate synthase [Caulobacter]ENZ83659.1 Undecaprenyl pyrophosphate synthetase [Caulobacter vibrioides OR37]MBQ1560545.1 di-trans,poly-cis-decaprenylcistransferase [Caulobacter sp.]
MPPTTGLQDVSARAGGDASEPRLHVAIIMDGNGRWAKRRGMPRVLGHRAGVNALKRTVEGAQAQNVGVLTVFGFSTENWRRPAHEVSELMKLLKAYVESDLERLAAAGVRVRIIGRRTGLPADIAEIIERAERRTAGNSEFVLQVAFNYGGQADITDAARAFAEMVERGEARASDLTEATFERFLSTAAAPPPDLIVRTSGERRISNFLLWDCAYAELVFQDVLWPDYGPDALAAAIAEYRGRDRRYGGVAADDVAVAG